MSFTMDTPMVFPILWVLPCISATVGTMGFAMYTPMGFYVYLDALFLSQKLHSKILCFSSLCSTKILSSFVSNWHFSQVNPPTSSAQSHLLSLSPEFPELSASSSVLHLCIFNPYLEELFLSQKLH